MRCEFFGLGPVPKQGRKTPDLLSIYLKLMVSFMVSYIFMLIEHSNKFLFSADDSGQFMQSTYA